MLSLQTRHHTPPLHPCITRHSRHYPAVVRALARGRTREQSLTVSRTRAAIGEHASASHAFPLLRATGCRTKVPVSDQRSPLTDSTTVALLTRVPSRARRQVSPLNPRLHRRFQLMRFGFRSLHTTSGHTGKPRMFRMYSKVAGCIIVVVTS
jgi:hypothetical protein